jgi:hypothetical protein
MQTNLNLPDVLLIKSNEVEKMNKQEQMGHIVVNACETPEESSYIETRFYVMGKYWNELYT